MEEITMGKKEMDFMGLQDYVEKTYDGIMKTQKNIEASINQAIQTRDQINNRIQELMNQAKVNNGRMIELETIKNGKYKDAKEPESKKTKPKEIVPDKETGSGEQDKGENQKGD